MAQNVRANGSYESAYTKIVFIDYPGYLYYIREGSIMHSGFTREKALAYNLYKKLYFAIVPRYPEFSELLIEKWI